MTDTFKANEEAVRAFAGELIGDPTNMGVAFQQVGSDTRLVVQAECGCCVYVTLDYFKMSQVAPEVFMVDVRQRYGATREAHKRAHGSQPETSSNRWDA